RRASGRGAARWRAPEKRRTGDLPWRGPSRGGSDRARSSDRERTGNCGRPWRSSSTREGAGRCASGGLAPRLSRQSYFDLPAPQLYERVGVACLTGGGAWAAVAAAAVLQRLPGVREQHAAPANGAGDVGSHVRRALGPREVGRAPEDQAERRAAI